VNTRALFTAADPDWLRRFARVASALIAVSGGLTLIGWIFDFPTLIRLLPGLKPMNPVSAVMFVLLGLALRRLGSEDGDRTQRGGSLAPRPQRLNGVDPAAESGAPVDRPVESSSHFGWARLLAGIVALVGGVRLADSVFGFRFHVDRVLFAHWLGAEELIASGGMAPNTAFNFVLCGLALLLLDLDLRRGLRPGQALALFAGLIGLLALVGYSYRMVIFSRVTGSIPMALGSAINFDVFCLGYLASRPRKGVMALLTSPTTGGAIARRLLPMAVLIPWILGGLLLSAEQKGLLHTAWAVSIFSVASILIFSVLTWWNATLLYRADLERAHSERRLAAQHGVTRVVAEAPNIEHAIPQILRQACENLGWPVGTMWMVEDPPTHLKCVEVWHAVQEGFAAFEAETRKLRLGPGEGLAGRVWRNRQAVWISDVADEPGFLRAGAAEKAGLHGAFGFPVLVGLEMFGVIEFFSREIEEEDHTWIEIAMAMGTQIGLFIERTRAQERLRRATANLERSNTELQQFAYIASHDLNEPLRMITSYLQLLGEKPKEKLDERSQEFIGFAVDGAKRMRALIADLLEYSRLDVRTDSFGSTKSEEVLQSVLQNLKVAAHENSAVIEHCPMPEVLADPVQLAQVFQNLIGNAIKFHGAEAPHIQVGAERNGREWIFSVRDNGIGVDPKYFERIFQIFQRLHTRQEYSGTGIGLAICKKIIERHGGRIWVESAPGRGATFFFTLPATN
jgi:signal transduction histidine kinase